MQKTTKKIAEGLGLAALAAGAAATYFFYGPGGKTRQKNLKVWSKKAKEELVKKIKSMKGVSKQAYDSAAKEVLAKYKQIKNIDPKEVEALGKELKGHWEKIAKDLSKMGSKKPTATKRKTAKAKK